MGWTPPAVGQRGTWSRTFTIADVEALATLTGDRNPLRLAAWILLALGGPVVGIAAMWRLRGRPDATRMASGHR